MRKLRHHSIGLFYLLTLALGMKTAGAQTIDYSVHANIVYHITKYIDWPDNKKTGDFVIGIIGDSPLSDNLKNVILNKSIGGQKIIIKNFPSHSGTAFKCQILFISDDESHNLKKIAALSEGMPVLIITESEGLAYKGSCINFIIEDEHLRLEFNKNNMEKRNLKIASELLKLGKIVEENKNLVKN